MSSEPSTDGDLSAEGSETSTSDESSRVSTMARTVARQLESHLLGSGVEELGGTRTQTRALNREATSLVTMFGPDEGGKIFHGLQAAQDVTRKMRELPKCLVREAGSETVSYPAEYSDAWVEGMRAEFDGLVANLCGSD